MAGHQFVVPDEDQLMEFFGSQPIERAVEDGYWCYEVVGPAGTSLRFSLNIYERSVQTELRLGAIPLATISHEMATLLRVDGLDLRCEFLGSDCRTTLTIHGREGFRTIWSTLQTE